MKNVDSLSPGAVDATAHEFDFGRGYPDGWAYAEAAECYECGHMETRVLGEEKCPECREGWLYSEGAMMNYWWTLPDRHLDLDAAAEKLSGVPLCIVYREGFDDVNTPSEYGLALTGGGRDLSWEIAEAYIRLGYLPPSELSLPHMAGMENSERNRQIVEALQESQKVAGSWAESRGRRTRETLDWLESEGR